jgi:hypothetical protein
MSDCIHCDIHDLLEGRLQGNEVNLAPPDERSTLMADVLANLGQFVLEKGEDATAQSNPRRHMQ